MPPFNRTLSPPIGFVFDVIDPTWISVDVTPGASTGTFFVKSVPENVVTGPPEVVPVVVPLSLVFEQAPSASPSTASGTSARRHVVVREVMPCGSPGGIGSILRWVGLRRQLDRDVFGIVGGPHAELPLAAHV